MKFPLFGIVAEYPPRKPDSSLRAGKWSSIRNNQRRSVGGLLIVGGQSPVLKMMVSLAFYQNASAIPGKIYVTRRNIQHLVLLDHFCDDHGKPYTVSKPQSYSLKKSCTPVLTER
jgi:hypothetical protein